jgi:predicted dehydrogenase/threonine dehydrogenase-like Zn-dependent dehydrogenase
VKQLFNVNGRVVIEDVPTPGITADMVLVATQASVISVGTETASLAIAGQNPVKRALAEPKKAIRAVRRALAAGPGGAAGAIRAKLAVHETIGYSAAGRVIAVGANVHDLVVGDLVACGGVGYANHAEVIAVPRLLVARVPDGVSVESAAYTTLGAIALQSVRRLEPTVGDYVVVLGLGLLGQIAAQLLRASGCRVLGVDLDPHRIDVARRMGIDALAGSDVGIIESRVREDTGGHGADAVLVAAASSSSDPSNQGIRLCRKRGRVVLLGATGTDLDRKEMYVRELDVRMATSYGPGRYDPAYEEHNRDYPFAYVRWSENRNMVAFLDVLRSRQVVTEPLTEMREPITAAEKAYERIQSATPKPIGVVFQYPNSKAHSARDSASRRILIPASGAAARSSAAVARVGVIGVSSFAREVILPALRDMPGVELRSLSSRDGGNATRAAKRFGAEAATTDSDSVLRDDTVNTVFVTGRHSEHAPLALAALRAGKHVFLEKPMAVTEAEATELASVAAQSGLRFTVGFNRRFAPLVSELRKVMTGVSGPFMLHYRVNAMKMSLNHWQYEAAEGGGRIVGEASHFLDLLWAIVGERPSALAAFQASGQAGDHPASEDMQVMLRFPGGSVAHLLYTALGDKSLPKERLEVFRGGAVAVLNNFERLDVFSGETKRRITGKGLDKGHRAQFAAFIEAVRDPKYEHPLGPAESLVATMLAFRALESAGGAGLLELDWS